MALLPGSPQSPEENPSDSYRSSEVDQTGPLLGRAATGRFEEDDEMSMAARCFIFVVFTQVMQALMSYDGGATQMSTQPLLEHGWSSSELGLLGAMDKFGQVATAFFWSQMLMRYDNKSLLVIGLFAKAACCLGFGCLEKKWMMLGAKLGMGVSEALIGVWATVWVQSHAPEDSQARWLGFASISAGTGNGIGSAVAGLCSATHGYAFAFVCQAAVMFFLWLVMLFTPGHFFSFPQTEPAAPEPPTRDSPTRLRRSLSVDPEHMMHYTFAESFGFAKDKPPPSTSEDAEEPTFLESLTTVLESRLWLFTALAISLSCFLTSSIAYLWQNTTESVWHFNDQEATLSFLLTTGLGGLAGVTFGPKLFDQFLGGFATPSGVVKCLRWCTLTTLASVILGTLCALLFFEASWSMVHYEQANEPRGWLLAALLTGIFLVFALVNAMQGTLYGINTGSTTPETKAAAAGLTVSMQNIIGFAFGPLLPSITADAVGQAISAAWPVEGAAVVHSAQFSVGMAASLLAAWPLLMSVHLAARAASRKVGNA